MILAISTRTNWLRSKTDHHGSTGWVSISCIIFANSFRISDMVTVNFFVLFFISCIGKTVIQILAVKAAISVNLHKVMVHSPMTPLKEQLAF